MNDDELKSALGAWKAPEANPDLARRTWSEFQKQRRLAWRRWFNFSVSLPAPALAFGALAIFGIGGLLGMVVRLNRAPGAVVQTRTVTRPAVHEKVVAPTVVVPQPAQPCPVPRAPNPPAPQRVAALTLAGFQPVSEIRPQIIRRN